ncbi:hydrogenase expression/formation protein HypE [Granulosicoccaceae sp. 1_MG-2023]|nr:hydrogenase expression/formation protein HypE [Granulosicoccaceae sp. 1_MG-2023]
MSRRAKLRGDAVTLAHGSGGKAMRDLIDAVFTGTFEPERTAPLEDQARFDLAALATKGDRLALTTDSYVVDPLFFPGGNIGKLAVCGTVNDLAVGGARPLYLTCGMIIEEGLPFDTLYKVAAAMQAAAEQAGVRIVTGDTKVVHRGAADKLFINTAGVGVIPGDVNIATTRLQAGDKILCNGFIGDHGAAIVDARGELAIENTIDSDCQALNGLIAAMLDCCPDIHAMRDATRGGIASVLNEFAADSGTCIRLQESAIAVRDEVRGMCEILGLDPLYLANEGKLLAAVPGDRAQDVLGCMQAHPAGEHSSIIGEVSDSPAGRVVLQTAFGGERVVDMLVGEQLPRIC